MAGPSDASDTHDASPATQGGHQAVDTCPFFLKNRCHFGDRCRLAHPATAAESEPPASKPSAGATSTDSDSEGSAADPAADGDSSLNLAPPPGIARPKAQRTADGRRAKLRPAQDIIGRLQWDVVIDTSHVVVGYHDRFVGTLETPFNSVDWNADLVDLDSESGDIVIPRHRIRYFLYRGFVLWHRAERIDHVFANARLPAFVAACDEAAVDAVSEMGVEADAVTEVQRPGEECETVDDRDDHGVLGDL